MFCKNCGSPLEENSDFCPKCGCAVSVKSAAPQETVTQPDSQPEQNQQLPNQQQFDQQPNQQQFNQQQPNQQQFNQQQYGNRKYATFEFHDPAVDGNGPVVADFVLAIKRYIAHYADFNGRASRSEYWYAVLFSFIVSLVAAFIPVIGIIISLAMVIPGLAIYVRRLHDIGKSGFYYFMALIPFAGPFIMLYFACQPSVAPNQWS